MYFNKSTKQLESVHVSKLMRPIIFNIVEGSEYNREQSQQQYQI
jgi:hypothetical protein